MALTLPAVRTISGRHPKRRAVIAAFVVFAIPTSWSYTGYLTASGDAPTSVRTVDWFRDHGFESLVNRVEQWYYTRQKPVGNTANPTDLPVGVPHRERAWIDATEAGVPNGAVQEMFVRPDARYRSVVVDLVRLDQRAFKLVYVPGTREPGGGPFAWGSRIPPSERSKVVAAFNAGFKFQHIRGGAFSEGREFGKGVRPGSASLVLYRDGNADVIDWRRGAKLTSNIVSVRQNLALIVDKGRPAAGLRADRGRRWGTPKSQFQFTWRSAVGVDAAGRIVYAATRKATLSDLARAMVDAGCVRAMQLDIHPETVSFNWYRPDVTSPFGVSGTKLMRSMDRSANRYLVSDQRDFLAVETR